MVRALLVVVGCAACGRANFDVHDARTDTGSSTGGEQLVVENCVGAGLIAHWAFDEATGTVASDSINGNDGILTNMDPATDWIPGQIGNALDFDGLDDRVVVPASPALSNLGPSTWTFWTNMRPAEGTLAYKSDDNGDEGWWISSDTGFGGFGLSVVHSSSNLRHYSSMFVVGAWSHVVITWNGTGIAAGISIYVNAAPVVADGSTDDSDGTHADDSIRDVIIGAGSTGANKTFDGAVDDLRIYNRVLTLPEIIDLHAGCP